VPIVLDLAKVRSVSEIVQKAGGYTLEAWKPLVGETVKPLFARKWRRG